MARIEDFDKHLDLLFAFGGALGGSWVAGLGAGNIPQDNSRGMFLLERHSENKNPNTISKRISHPAVGF